MICIPTCKLHRENKHVENRMCEIFLVFQCGYHLLKAGMDRVNSSLQHNAMLHVFDSGSIEVVVQRQPLL